MTTTCCDMFSFNLRVRCYEQDLKGRLRPGEVFNWFQEAANRHCMINRVALEDIQPKGYTWIIHRYKISIAKIPVCGQECKISTWSHPKRDLISIRDFSAESMNGERLISAASEWALIDLKRQRPVRLSSVLPELPAIAARALDEELRPVKIPEAAVLFKSSEANASAWSLDKNRHVNNSVYVFWAYDNLYPEIPSTFKLKELEINYKKQAFFGQDVECRSFSCAEGVYFQNMILKESGETLALLKSVWEKEC